MTFIIRYRNHWHIGGIVFLFSYTRQKEIHAHLTAEALSPALNRFLIGWNFIDFQLGQIWYVYTGNYIPFAYPIFFLPIAIQSEIS